MQLLTRELKKQIPALYSQEQEKDPRVICKFFDPVGSWTWYVLEGSPIDTNGEVCAEHDAVDFLFFGFVVGFEAELGYFTERELETAKDGVRGLQMVPIERDLYFYPVLVVSGEKATWNRNFLKKGGKIMIYLKDSNVKVESTEDVAKVFQDILSLEDPIEQDKEHFYVMHLNVRNQVKMVELVNVGVLTYSPVHPMETFRRAVIAGSAAIIIAHNHPSGEADTSDEDTKLTKHIFEAGRILGIDMLDHIIFTKDMYFSFKENKGGEIQI